MVACRSCGRNIASGTIRCTRCSSPFHLSCSHRYKISSDGVFNVCCGEDSNFLGNATFNQMRPRRNKRRQPFISNNHQQQQLQQSAQSANSANEPELIDDSVMRYAKVQKVERIDMGYNDKQTGDNSDNGEILQIDYDNNQTDHDDSIEIIEDIPNSEVITLDEPVQNTTPNPINNSTNSTNNSNRVTLDTVWEGISNLQNAITNISNSLSGVSTKLNTFDPRMNDLEASLNTIKLKTSNFDNVQNDVSGLKDQLTQLSNDLENMKSQQEPPLDFSQIFSEMREREMKSKNILIYNVPEDNLRISQDYSTLEDINKFNALLASRDASRAREILSNIPDIDLDDIFTRRLGQIKPNWNRPLRVILQCKEEVIQVMRNKRAIPRQYTVKTDLTKYQQNKIKELKEELLTINDVNNPTMTIKFVSGEPRIIPIRRDYAKPE